MPGAIGFDIYGTLKFMPWISESTIRRAYRKTRDLLHRGDNRPLTKRTLAVMRFVSDHTDDEGKRPSWERLTRRWNEECPDEWKFKDRFGLRKAYLSAEQVLWV